MIKQIAWLNARPYCWAASIDGGKTWIKLKADDPDYSPEPIEEAVKIFGGSTNEWEVLEEPITTLMSMK